MYKKSLNLFTDVDNMGRLEFAKWVHDERLKRDWKMRELAERAGLHISLISFIEHGDRGANINVCTGLARAFQADVTEVLKLAGLIGNSIPDEPLTDPMVQRITDIASALNEADKAYALQFLHFLKTHKGKPDVRPSPRASPDILGRVRPKQKEKTPAS